MSDDSVAENLRDASEAIKSIQQSFAYLKGLAYGFLIGVPLGFALGWVVLV